MKKLFSGFLAWLFLISVSRAACTGSGLTWSCPSGSSIADVQSALNSASDGATITLAAGSYTWTSGALNPSVTKGWTIICASAPAAVGASTTAPCTVAAGGTVISAGGFPNDNKLRRISGLTINQSSGSFLTYFCSGGGCTGTFGEFRGDHNTLNLATGGVGFFFGDSAAYNLHAYGVIDHNLVQAPGSAFLMEIVSTVESGSTVTTSPLGTANNLFLENNIVNVASLTNSGTGCTDGWGSAFAVVFRYNSVTNCRVLAHGIGDGGGPDNFEVYHNAIIMNSGAVGSGIETCYRCVHDQGAGTLMVWNNSLTPVSGYTDDPNAIVFQDFRDCGNGPSCNEGSKPPACDSTVVAATYPGTTYTFSDGNRSPSTTWWGYPCWHQPGRDESGNYKPMFSWANVFTDTSAQASLVLNGNVGSPPPGCTPGASGNCAYDSIHMLANREWFNAVSALAQSSPTSPFNGTTGMGFGTLANRPMTCTTSTEPAAGVGYFATDVGAQGTEYTCSATNTWTVYYVPYTYPHPLVTGGTPFVPPASPFVIAQVK